MKRKYPTLSITFSTVFKKLVRAITWRYHKNKYYIKYRKYGIRENKLSKNIINSMIYMWNINPSNQDLEDYKYYQIDDQEKEYRLLRGRKCVDYYLSAGEIEDPFYSYGINSLELTPYSVNEIKELEAYFLSKYIANEHEEVILEEFHYLKRGSVLNYTC